MRHRFSEQLNEAREKYIAERQKQGEDEPEVVHQMLSLVPDKMFLDALREAITKMQKRGLEG